MDKPGLKFNWLDENVSLETLYRNGTDTFSSEIS